MEFRVEDGDVARGGKCRDTVGYDGECGCVV